MDKYSFIEEIRLTWQVVQITPTPLTPYVLKPMAPVRILQTGFWQFDNKDIVFNTYEKHDSIY